MRAARDEVLAAARAPRLGQSRVRAAVLRLALGPLDRRVAGRAALGHRERRARCRRAGRSRGPDHLRDHVARALHDHGVADADVLAVDVLLVVQRRELDDRRRRPRPARGSRTGSASPVRPTLMPMSSSFVVARGRRELERDRPARVAADDAERSLHRRARRPSRRRRRSRTSSVGALAPRASARRGARRRWSSCDFVSGLTGKPRSRSQSSALAVRVELDALERADRVAPERERPAGGDAPGPSAAASRPRSCAGS